MEKKRKCWQKAFYPFPTMSSTIPIINFNFHLFILLNSICILVHVYQFKYGLHNGTIISLTAENIVDKEENADFIFQQCIQKPSEGLFKTQKCLIKG